MILNFFRRRLSQPQHAQTTVPQGERLYAIGDIHGRLDLLADLLDMIASDDFARGGDPATLIFLGDLIDRGPDSAGVITKLLKLEQERPAGKTRFLLGNHEEVFLSALDDDERALRFLIKIGGRETILSYGISPEDYRSLDYSELLKILPGMVPQSHRDFLSRFEDLIVIGDYAFVHAGVRPEEPLARQKSKDLRWIRDDFTSYRGTYEKVVVHGHTISDDVEVLSHRIGLDTGAFASGKLTAMGFEASNRWLLQTQPI